MERISRLPSISPSIKSNDIIRSMNPKTHKDKLLGLCRREPLTTGGRRIQRIKILSVTLLPILVLWGFAVSSFGELLSGKAEVQQTQYTVKFSVEVGKLLNSIQRERDMSILYLSMLGPGTKTFLINEYQLTDKALDKLSDWPANSALDSFFHTKESFKAFLNNHRSQLNLATVDIFVEMEFYNKLIERFMHWMYGAIRESKKTSIWKILVSYQKIVTGMEQLGIERALGVIYYVKGGFRTNKLYEEYNNNVNTFKANYRSAVLYSKEIDPIFQKAVTSSGKNLTTIIETYRYEIQHNLAVEPSIAKTQWWFDNMTLYLDVILVVQLDLATLIDGQLQEIIESETKTLLVYGVVLVLVILMCPAVVHCVETMTSSIQQIAVQLVNTTKKLAKEQQRFRATIGYTIPVTVSRTMSQAGSDVEVQSFPYVTVLAAEIFGLNRFVFSRTLSEVSELLNNIFTSIDKSLVSNNIIKFEANNEHIFVASGFNMRRKDQAAGNVADFALDLLDTMTSNRFLLYDNQRLHFRIAIHTGPCIGGIVGNARMRYGIYGNTINTVNELQEIGLPGRINVSLSTYKILTKVGKWSLKTNVTGEDINRSFWLLGYKSNRATNANVNPSEETETTEGEQFSAPADHKESC